MALPPSAPLNASRPPAVVAETRTMSPGGRIAIRRIGLPRRGLGDVYHTLVNLRWRWLFAVIVAGYALVNCGFALLYMLQPAAIENARASSFLDHFYFSVQTMATIGYGKMTPTTHLANALVSVEALLGMLAIAMATGLIFAKFARARPRVMFSSTCVVTTFDGRPTLMFRVGNERATQIVEAAITVAVLRDERTVEGERVRRITELPLVRSRSAVFALSWQVMHPIDERSPFHDATPESLAAVGLELVVSLTGLEEVTGQTVHARHAYHWRDLRWSHRFADVITVAEDGSRTIDYGKFHDVVELPRREP